MTTCRFEADVLAAVAAGSWDHAPEELKAHVTTCGTCSDLALVSQLLKTDHAAMVAEANVPSAGQVWWRAQMRARQEDPWKAFAAGIKDVRSGAAGNTVDGVAYSEL